MLQTRLKKDGLLTCARTGELSDSCSKTGHLQIIGSSETGQNNQPRSCRNNSNNNSITQSWLVTQKKHGT